MHWLIVGAIALGAGAGSAALFWGAWWAWWRLPKRQVDRLRLHIRDPKARADVEDNFRKTIGQLLGGAAVLIGAGLAYLQFSQQQQTAQQQFTQQQQASHELLISNQVAKGFEQLGSDKDVVRLGGIYALEGAMNTSEQYHQPILEALCAFVRDGTRSRGDRPLATEIQAALTVIGRRSTKTEASAWPGLVDLGGAHIPGAGLSDAKLSGANLAGADLHGAHMDHADLSRAILVEADLSGALMGQADLSGAILIKADMRGAVLIKADLRDAHMDHADLSSAILLGGDLSGADVSQAQLDEAGCMDGVKLPRGLNLKPCN
jgi:uncharacterized protein YjbI with pentapeptide repeats